MKDFIPKDKRLVAGSIVVSGLLLLFLIFAYIPKHRLITELKTHIKNVEQQIEITQAMLGDMERLAQVLADMQKELTSFENRLPGRKQISLVLSELSNLAKLSFVEVVSIKPQEPEPLLDSNNNPISLGTRPLKSMKVELKLRAPYQAIAEYVKNVQDSSDIFATIDEISMIGNEQTVPGLNTRLVFTVYIVDKG